MKIAILGGGITGMTAAYYLAKAGHKVTLIEKGKHLGGLARGFKAKNWEWPLEYAYHHLFANDLDIQNFAKEIGFNDIYFTTPHTNSLYGTKGNYRIIPVDSPKDFLLFPLLSVRDKFRAACILAVLKFLPAMPLYESMTAKDFVCTYMGENMWNVFFRQLFRKKFGKYADKITAIFLWARIHKRTQSLGYIRGGFQTFIDFLESALIEQGVTIRRGTEVRMLREHNDKIKVNGRMFDAVVSTLPSPVLSQAAKEILPKEYIDNLRCLSYLHALVIVLETDKPILSSTYWLNICTRSVPAMVVVQHTHFVDKRHYGGNHLAYVGYYLDRSDPLMHMDQIKLIHMLEGHLRGIENSAFKIISSKVFKGPFAQPIFDKDFPRRKPDFDTPVEHFYIANLDMTYPYDRGTNYAVSLGKAIAEKIR